jgi:hypothetical protein
MLRKTGAAHRSCSFYGKLGFVGEMELAYCCFSVFLKTTVVSETSLLLFSEFLDFNSKKFSDYVIFHTRSLMI